MPGHIQTVGAGVVDLDLRAEADARDRDDVAEITLRTGVTNVQACADPPGNPAHPQK